MHRVAYLVAQKGKPLPLASLELKADLLEDYAELLPRQSPEASRRTRGEQEVMVRHEPQRALETLPELVRAPKDRERLLQLIDKVTDDDRVEFDLTKEQLAMLAKIANVLGATGAAQPKVVVRAKSAAPRKTVAKTKRKKAR